MTARVIAPGAGEVIGDAPDRRVEILCDLDGVHATWSRFAAGRDGADLHVHREHTDFFYVLDGEFTLRLGLEDEQIAAPAGTLVRVPPMVVHGFRNASTAEVRYLNFHAPGAGFATYMRGLRDGEPVVYDQIDPPDEGVRPPGEATFTSGGGVLADGPELRVALLAPEDVAADGVTAVYVVAGEAVLADGTRLPAGTWVEGPAGGLRAGDGPPARVLELRAGG